MSALRQGVSAYLGEFAAKQHELVYRILGELHAGQYNRVIELSADISSLVLSLAALPIGRAYLALGKLDEAEKWLQVNRRRQLTYGMIDFYESHHTMAFLLGEFYLAVLATRRGRKDEAAKRYKFFLDFAGASPAPLPQIKAASAALAK